MPINKPANRPRFGIGLQARESINTRLQRRLTPSRPFGVTITTGSGSSYKPGQLVAIVAGADKGQAGRIVSTSGGVVFVDIGGQIGAASAAHVVAFGGPDAPAPR